MKKLAVLLMVVFAVSALGSVVMADTKKGPKPPKGKIVGTKNAKSKRKAMPLTTTTLGK